MAFLENPLPDRNLKAKLDFVEGKKTTEPLTEEVPVYSSPTKRFDDIYLNHKKGLVAFAKKNFSLSDLEIEDAVQEAFMQLLKHLDEVTPGKEPGWLKKTISNKLKRSYAIKANRLRILRESFIPEQHREMMTRNTIDHLVKKEQEDLKLQNLEKLERCIELLPPSYKEVVKLFFLEGMRHDAIAKKLGIEASTSRANLTKAIAKLRKIYNQI